MDEVGKYKNRTSTQGFCSKQTPSTLLLKCFPSWTCFSAFKNIYGRKQGLRMFVCLTYQRCCHASSTESRGLLQKGSAAGKDGRLTPGENQGMGRKPSRSAEQKEVHFLNWGLQLAGEPAAQPSQHLHSLLRMSLPWLPRDKQPDHLLHLPHPTSPLNICLTGSRGLLPLPSRQRHMVFSYSCISSIRVWGVSCFGSAAPSADNACHLIYRQ